MKIHCPNCNQEYEVPEEYIGQKAECEKCSYKFIIEEPRAITETVKISFNGNEYLVDGKHTYESAKDKKHDIEFMKKCCDAELKTMAKTGMVAAPAYFERVAILSRKEKNYKQEIEYCQKYIEAIDKFYKKYGTDGIADVRKGSSYEGMIKRLPKAKELLRKQNNSE